METRYNEVYVEGNGSQLHPITPKYVYLTIPAEYVCIYHKLLKAIADYGKDIIDDCNAVCKGDGKNLFNCWNLFQSAIACKELGKEKEAKFFIDYIEAQIKYINRINNVGDFNGPFPATIDDEGKLKAMVSCGSEVKFEVDEVTGKLYEEWLQGKEDGKVYVVDDNGVMSVSDVR